MRLEPLQRPSRHRPRTRPFFHPKIHRELPNPRKALLRPHRRTRTSRPRPKPPRLGGPAGGVFGHDFAPPNQSWDHTRWGLTAAVSYKLFDPNKYFQLWVGGQAGFLNFSGNENSPGQLNGAEFGAHGAIASRGLYQNKTIQGPELGLYLGGFFARGK